MAFLTKLSANTPAVTRNAWSQHWYDPEVFQSLTGVRVTPDIAFKVAGVYASCKVIGETFGSLPCIMYERRERSRRRATEHRLYSTLRYEPNVSQTAFEFQRLMVIVALLYGTAYARIGSDRTGGFATDLQPLPPNRTRQKVVDGEIVVEVWNEDGTTDTYLQDEVFMLPGISTDGVSALGIPDIARDTIGLAIATEQYGSRFFSQSSQPGGVLEHPNVLGKEATERLAASWQAARSGLNSAHKVVVLEDGMKYTPTVMSAEAAQMIETRKFQLEEIARYFRLPPHKIGILDKATFSNIEEQGLEFVTDTMQPLVTAYEQRIRKQLIIDQSRYMAEFLLDNILRGRAVDRANVYTKYVNFGVMTRNEVRERENMNPLDGLDEPLMPLNLTDGEDEETSPASVPRGSAPPQTKAIVERAASRLVNKEVRAVQKAIKFSGNAEELDKAVTEFYECVEPFQGPRSLRK